MASAMGRIIEMSAGERCDERYQQGQTPLAARGAAGPPQAIRAVGPAGLEPAT